MVGLIFIIYISFFRKRPVILPIILENRIIQNGKTAPDWLKRWADYEKLPWHQKAYRKLQALSGILLFQVDKNLTPKEFIGALNKNFEVNEKSGKLFLDLYQKSTYGDMNDISADIYFENYKKILSLILKSWKDKRIEEIRFTMRLMKTR
jgi:hypothetical protein